MIDWFTVFAQIFNFLILVFLLKRFLYGPIIAAIDKREENISARIEEAEQKRHDAEEEKNKYRKKNEDFEKQREDMHAQMKEETESQKKELLEDARQEIEDIKARWNESIMQERDMFLKNLRRRIVDQAYTITRRALSDLATIDLEQHIVSVFIKKIKEFNKANSEALAHTLRDTSTGITIATSLELPTEQRQSIIDAIHSLSVQNNDVKFIVSNDVLCGIEFQVKGHVIGWNLQDYLNSLKNDFNKALEAGTGKLKR